MGLIIAGERSGVGKTTVTLALLAALRQWGEGVQAFKVGPDYIDPMFHRVLTGRDAYNLDPVLTSEDYVRRCYDQHRRDTPYALVEGVMGLFDGAGGGDWGSTAHIARLLNLPVVLVVDCGRLSRSLAAIVQGYRHLDPQVQVAGVVLNRVGSDRHRAMLLSALAPLHIPVVGILPRDGAVTLPDRHLGLVPTDELPDLPQRFDYLATLGQRCFDWDWLRPRLAAGANSVAATNPATDPETNPATDPETAAINPEHLDETISVPLKGQGRIRLGIARDRAFNFYYPDNLDLLARLGAELVPWSPLGDATLPQNLDGLYLGGGFPELFAAALAQNQPLREDLCQRLATGLPALAECGGLMYLARSLTDLDGHSWPMVGALPTATTMTERLTLGYRRVTACQDSILMPQGSEIWGHEFHRSVSTIAPLSPLYQTQPYPISGEKTPPALTLEGWHWKSIHASYVHLHWGDHPQLPTRFLTHCRQYHQNSP